MALDATRIHKPIRKLRKFLKKDPKRPTPEEIHDLRTNARRLETTIAALRLDSNGNEQRMLRELGRIRKRAGKVRDMDVLTEHASTVHVDGEQECLVQVLEHLGAERNRQVKKLRALIGKYGPDLRWREKRSAADIDKLLQQDDKSRNGLGAAAPVDAMATALRLSAELGTPTRLDRKNLHPYRLKVKELRYLLQLASNADEQPFVDKLGQVKDGIGEWHDWEELIAIANKVLDHGANCKLLRKLRATSNAKYEDALALANDLRNTYLFPKASTDGASSTGAKMLTLTRPVLAAISAIAA